MPYQWHLSSAKARITITLTNLIDTEKIARIRCAAIDSGDSFPWFIPLGYLRSTLPLSSLCTNSSRSVSPDRPLQSKTFPTVPMLSVTGRPRGYAGYGGSPLGWRSARGRQCVWRCRLLSYIAPPLYAFEITLLLSANNGELCEWKTRKEKEGRVSEFVGQNMVHFSKAQIASASWTPSGRKRS